jgi:hypothetical protein
MGAAALSGVLLALAFPAFDIGVLALVALVPPLLAWRGETPGRAALYGFVFGVVFAGILLYWLWYFGIVAIVPLVAGWAAYTTLTGYLVGCLNSAGLRSPWLIAAAGSCPRHCADAGRSAVCRGDLGVALHDFPPARAVAAGAASLRLVRARRVQRASVELAIAPERGGDRSSSRPQASAWSSCCRRCRRALPDPSLGRAACRHAQGNDQDRYLTTEEKRKGTSPSSTSREPATGRYDPSCSPNRRSTN